MNFLRGENDDESLTYGAIICECVREREMMTNAL